MRVSALLPTLLLALSAVPAAAQAPSTASWDDLQQADFVR